MKFIKRIRMKYFLSLLAVSVLPVLFFSFYTLQSNRNFYNNQIEQASKNEVRRITTRINENYADVQKLLESLLFSNYDGVNCMTSLCQQEGSDKSITKSQRLKNYRMFKYICTNLLENASNVDGVYLFCENGHVYSYMVNQNYGIEKNYLEARWYKDLLESGDSLEIADMVDIPINVYGKSGKCFLTARKFQSVKGTEKAVLAVVGRDRIFDDVSRDNHLPWGNSLIVDGDGNVLCGSWEDTPLTKGQIQGLSREESGIIRTEDVRNAFVYGTLSINDWVVISNISFESYHDFYIRNSRILLVLIVIDVLVILIIVFYMDKSNIRPIVRLAQIMGNTTEQGFLFHNDYKERQDEIGILYSYYEKMIHQIDSLIQEKYENEIKILKSRLRNLTSQINAHFIFNTLENISCLAQIEGNKQIGIMSKSLGDMLRYSMDYEGDFVRLEREISHIRQYLNIQEVRFGNEIHLRLGLEEGSEKRKVMRFMLQPIIENAIEHGMTDQEKPFEIIISTERFKEDLIIRISDSGAGIDETNLERIRKRIYEPEEVEEEMECFNIGLVNIHQRIQLLYSEKYGLGIESIPDEGTTVILTIPWM
ncbi:MAG: histidine kinase [Eubacteriales bacterium]|nr:histidine kinase [Eubacteriales bacterium]